MDVYSATITHKRMGRVIIDVVTLADHEQAMAEKDREIATLKHDYAQLKEAYDATVAGVQLGPIVGVQTIINQQMAYRQLMERAVRWASYIMTIDDKTWESYKDAEMFLNSPEVEAWKERHDTQG